MIRERPRGAGRDRGDQRGEVLWTRKTEWVELVGGVTGIKDHTDP